MFPMPPIPKFPPLLPLPALPSLLAILLLASPAPAIDQSIGVGAKQGARGENVPPFQVRAGYKVTLAADQLGEARFLERDDQGTVFLSQPGRGQILALRPAPDGTLKPVGPFIKDKPTVHGLCFKDGWLWFTQTGAIHKARVKPGGAPADEIVTVVPEGQLPQGGGHWWRSIVVTDDAFYTSIGDSSNIADQTGTERQKIWKFSLDGKKKTLFASGLRNTEKLRLRPGTAEIWGADHGSDNFGAPLGEKDDRQPVTDFNPPCEFNHYVEGGFYGHPFIVGDRIPRIEYQNRPDILDLAAKTIPPAWSLGAHWAPNAFAFLTQDYFPGHKGDALIALHGSWNSTTRVGYGIQRILFDSATGRPCGALRIVTTLGPDDKVLARPVDLLEMPDGTVLFSCDQTKRIYRLTREAP